MGSGDRVLNPSQKLEVEVAILFHQNYKNKTPQRYGYCIHACRRSQALRSASSVVVATVGDMCTLCQPCCSRAIYLQSTYYYCYGPLQTATDWTRLPGSYIPGQSRLANTWPASCLKASSLDRLALLSSSSFLSFRFLYLELRLGASTRLQGSSQSIE